jgi:hypothetical protein
MRGADKIEEISNNSIFSSDIPTDAFFSLDKQEVGIEMAQCL